MPEGAHIRLGNTQSQNSAPTKTHHHPALPAPLSQVTPIPIPHLKSQIQTPEPQSPIWTKAAQKPSQPPNYQPASEVQTDFTATRPPVSPLTPPPVRAQLAKPPPPNDFAQGRPVLTHSQPAQTAIPPPHPIPLSLESNPDAIALRSAIAILQNQRARAIHNIQTLQKAKDEAIRNPEAFAADLHSGKVNVGGGDVGGDSSLLDLALPPTASPEVSSDSSSEEDGLAESSQAGLEKLRRRQERSRRRAEKAARRAAEPAWRNLPGPQDVVRCPPINWTKYAVVGDSLDKLHAEQRARPPEGTPATIGPNGVYEFKAGDGTERPGREYLGIAASYNPGRDQIMKRQKAKK